MKTVGFMPILRPRPVFVSDHIGDGVRQARWHENPDSTVARNGAIRARLQTRARWGTRMRLSDPAELGLGLGSADFDEVFRPFLKRWAEPGDSEWRQALRERDASMRSKLLRRWLPGFKRARTDERIRQEYDKVWSRREFEKYALDSVAKRPS